VKVPELDTSVFVVPGHTVKNEEDRLVVLNSVAKSVIESVRGQHRKFVFTFTPRPRKARPGEVVEIPVPQPIAKMNNTAWKSARSRAADKWSKEHGEPAPGGFRKIRVHDLKHTSAAACGRPACPLRTGRTCSATRAGGLRRTTLKLSWQI
jgi:integrase